MTTQYEKLLSLSRYRPSTVSDRNMITEAESDRGRLLFCSAFRRLQQKAQVFSMESNAAVRSRLTHSLEVSQMGRYIADLVSFELVSREWATRDECRALVTYVETACLMHDIGNPPFGHFGEAAIREWFRLNGPSVIGTACRLATSGDSDETENPRLKKALADFVAFDGNPQGLRVVAKLQRNSDEFGLNLTKTTIGAFLKYVKSTDPDHRPKDRHFGKKSGYFMTETDIVGDLWEELGYLEPRRFPLAYIMEAADDIAYCISDLEDSIEKRLLAQKKSIEDVLAMWDERIVDVSDPSAKALREILVNAEKGERRHGLPFTFTDFRTSLNRKLCEFASERYIAAHDDVCAGTAPPLLEPGTPEGDILLVLKEYCRTHVYRHENVQKVELAGYKAIYGLLEHFKCLLECNTERFHCALDYANEDKDGKPIVVEKKLLSLFPPNYKKVYDHDLRQLSHDAEDFAFGEWSLRAHLITDFIAGMTDDFAVTTYQTLSGMRL